MSRGQKLIADCAGTHNLLMMVGLVMALGACSQGGDEPGGGGPGPVTPEVEQVAPTNGSESVVPASIIEVRFSVSMDRSSVEAALSISPTVACSFTWNAANDVVTCDPQGDLAYETQYTVTVASTAQSQDGTQLGSTFSAQFTTVDAPDEPADPAPVVTSTTPDNLAVDVSLDTDITIEFSEPMDTASVEAAIGSDPLIPCTISWNASSTRLTCQLTADLAPSTTYLVGINPTAQSAAGVTLEEPFTIIFATEGAQIGVDLYVFGGPGPVYDVYLGCLTCSDFDSESVFNDFGTFDEFSSPSMDNQFDTYGSPYSSLSACSEYATDPPRIFDAQGNYYGSYTVNDLAPDAINNDHYLDRLEEDVCND